MNKESQSHVETRPARLQFEHGTCEGTIYAHRVHGCIVQAYRGYSYQYVPLARTLRGEPQPISKF